MVTRRSPSPAAWAPWSAGATPAAGAIHVYRTRLARAPEEVERLAAWLSEDEQERARRFRAPEHRRQYVVTRATLRQVLAAWLGTGPAEVAFAYGPHGKPELAGARDLRFNAAHAGEWAVLAVGRGSRIGVDIEVVHEIDHLDSLARRCLSPRELQDFAALPPGQRLHAFFVAWTRKEALLKATGLGLSGSMRSLSVTLAPGAPARLLSWEEPGDWRLWELEVPAGLVGALASDGGETPVACWEI